MNDSNSVIVEAWNTVLYDKFVRFKHLLVDGLAQHSDAAFERCRFKQARACSTSAAASATARGASPRRVGPAGEAVGVDCAANFIATPRPRLAQEGVANARFFVGDAQMGDLRGPYDQAFARFGTMFFEMPGAAMRNVRKALKPGGTFMQVVWRKREDNPWLHEAELCVKAIVPVVSHEDTDQVHCGPGPFSMSGPDMVSRMLRVAGFERITFERFDCDICIGRDLDDAIEFAMALGPAGEIIRLAGDEGANAAAGDRGAEGNAGALRAARWHLGALEHLVHQRGEPGESQTHAEGCLGSWQIRCST